MIDQLLDAVKQLKSHGVPPGQEELMVGAAMFEKLLHAPDVVSGELELIQQEEPQHWLAVSHATGYRFNIFVSHDMTHWVNREANE